MSLALRVFLLVAFLSCYASLAAVEGPRTVPQAVAELLSKAAQADPGQVVKLVDAWSGEAHPLLLLIRGQARWRLAQDAHGAEHGVLATAAERDFAAALRLDASLKQAHLGMAQCAAARADWLTASREVAAGMDPPTADHHEMAFLAGTALRAGDWRLATLAAQQGIMRFPDDQQLRRIELSVLVHAGRAEDAHQAVLALLAHTPGDAELWRNLAWSAHETGREDEALGALEAALAVKDDDRHLRRQLAEAQLGHGMPQAALITVRPLVGDPPTTAAISEDGLMLVASRAAADGGDLALARAWLAEVPPGRQSRRERLASARYAVQAGDLPAAQDALDALIALGERDGAVLTMAASLAESSGDPARAEMLYLQAIGTEGQASGGAALRLTAFYITHGRRDEARTVLASYLARNPGDLQSKALQAQLERAPSQTIR